MRSWLLVIFGATISVLMISAVIYSQKIFIHAEAVPLASPIPMVVEPTPLPSPTLSPSPQPTEEVTSAAADLTVDTNGLSKATVVINTTEGTIKFKFFPNEAPKTVKRIIELVSKGFYNGLSFHRVVPGFVIQGGDPAGTGAGGSGQKLEAEFNKHRHLEGAVAMARATDINSADSQFYITLGTFPHLDLTYTVFGQVIEGIDVAKKIKIGSKMVTVKIE